MKSKYKFIRFSHTMLSQKEHVHKDQTSKQEQMEHSLDANLVRVLHGKGDCER